MASPDPDPAVFSIKIVFKGLPRLISTPSLFVQFFKQSNINFVSGNSHSWLHYIEYNNLTFCYVCMQACKE